MCRLVECAFALIGEFGIMAFPLGPAFGGIVALNRRLDAAAARRVNPLIFIVFPSARFIPGSLAINRLGEIDHKMQTE